MPALRCPRACDGAWARWSHVGDGTTCPPGDAGNSVPQLLHWHLPGRRMRPRPVSGWDRVRRGPAMLPGRLLLCRAPLQPRDRLRRLRHRRHPLPCWRRISPMSARSATPLPIPPIGRPPQATRPAATTWTGSAATATVARPASVVAPPATVRNAARTGDSNRVDGTCDPEGCPTDGFGGCGVEREPLLRRRGVLRSRHLSRPRPGRLRRLLRRRLRHRRHPLLQRRPQPGERLRSNAPASSEPHVLDACRAQLLTAPAPRIGVCCGGTCCTRRCGLQHE